MAQKKTKTTRGQRKALGRGLSALVSATEARTKPELEVVADEGNLARAVEGTTLDEGRGIRLLNPKDISANPNQPRREFDEEELRDLANSIREMGVLQPLIVRPLKDKAGKFEIIAGERRWRASQLAELTQIPVLIEDFDDKQTLQAALIENIQRSNLNPVEEARGYQSLVDDFSLSQKDIAQKVGKERATVANFLRLLRLPEQVLKLVREEKISLGHAKAILTVKEPSAQMGLARKVVQEGLSVRALESIVARAVVLDTNQKKPAKTRGKGRGDASEEQFPELVDRLRRSLGTKVSIRHQSSGRGKIEVEYYSEQELDRLIELLAG